MDKCLELTTTAPTHLFQNPYLTQAREAWRTDRSDVHHLRALFSWAVPDEDTIRRLALLYPRIVEVGAGTGYWAWLLSQAGADVQAYDIQPYANGWCSGQFYEVREGSSGHVAQMYPDRALLICWPPMHSIMASSALKHYQGSDLIYVGEAVGGCTGDEDFHIALGQVPYGHTEPVEPSRWELVAKLHIPQWPGIHDQVWCYHHV